MNHEREEDPSREYEMIWTLLQGKDEEEYPRKSKEGMTVKLLKFLFGSGSGGEEDPVDDYRERRRFHRHVYRPSPRHTRAPEHPSSTNDAPGTKQWQKLEAPGDLHPAPPPPSPANMMHTMCRLVMAVSIATVLLIMSSAANCLQIIRSMLNKEGQEKTSSN